MKLKDKIFFEKVLKTALTRKDLLNESDTSVIFYDLSVIEKRIAELKKYFPSTTLNTAAVKANPLLNILKFIRTTGLGAEAASLPELYLAQNARINPNKIVFDSPIKTENELKYALKIGVHINADSFEELSRIIKLKKRANSKSTFGIRINPQIGTGKIETTSVAGEYSKFGIPIKEFRRELLESIQKYSWLSGVHLHIGSQGCDIKMLTEACKIVYDFAIEVNNRIGKNQINTFDIGGGIPVSYKKDELQPSMKIYAQLLKKNCPKLFTTDFNLITEFGRWIFANAGWAVSRVEYVKKSKLIDTIMIHLGADMFIRKIYNPKDWYHEIIIIDAKGIMKQGKKRRYNIAGPLCFAGDFLEKNILLPIVEQGDYIIIKDTGAYTSSMWSRYNSRQFPKVIGYKENGKRFLMLKDRESLQKIKDFWS